MTRVWELVWEQEQHEQRMERLMAQVNTEFQEMRAASARRRQRISGILANAVMFEELRGMRYNMGESGPESNSS